MQPGDDAPKMKEIYAFLGYAMFLGQSLEGLMTQSVMVLVEFPKHMDTIKAISKEGSLEKWAAFVDSIDKKHQRKKLSDLIKILFESDAVAPEVCDCLEDARKNRNFVAHNFFKRYLGRLYHDGGQDDAIVYLKSICAVIENAISQLYRVILSQLATYGYDENFIKQECLQIIAEAK